MSSSNSVSKVAILMAALFICAAAPAHAELIIQDSPAFYSHSQTGLFSIRSLATSKQPNVDFTVYFGHIQSATAGNTSQNSSGGATSALSAGSNHLVRLTAGGDVVQSIALNYQPKAIETDVNGFVYAAGMVGSQPTVFVYTPGLIARGSFAVAGATEIDGIGAFTSGGTTTVYVSNRSYAASGASFVRSYTVDNATAASASAPITGSTFTLPTPNLRGVSVNAAGIVYVADYGTTAVDGRIYRLSPTDSQLNFVTLDNALDVVADGPHILVTTQNDGTSRLVELFNGDLGVFDSFTLTDANPDIPSIYGLGGIDKLGSGTYLLANEDAFSSGGTFTDKILFGLQSGVSTPEPSSLLFLTLGGAALMRRRSR